SDLARYVIARSTAVAASLRDQGLFPSEKIVTIRYGLDVDRFSERMPVHHTQPVIGSIGNLDPVKGFDILIRAAKIVTEQRPEVSFKIVGEDRSRDRRNEKELHGLIDELGLADSVELAGWSDNVQDVLAGFDIFVSASRSESFGFVIAEAMLSVVPVVATATEGSKEIISDPTLGRLVPTNSPGDLASAILGLCADGAIRKELAGSGRKHIETHFSMQRMADETEALYGRAI